ncbi:MAG: potassium-transporting ATPase subunit KdpA [Pyrinomonadaceae bacterium]|nr:potassium-transporting ATPase subunit KdpA [Pyrinomonadaceae bacterium]
MESSSWFAILQYLVFLFAVVVLVKPLGGYMANVFESKPTFLDFALRPIERLIYKICGVDEREEMTWQNYAVSFVLFSAVGTVILFLILRLQSFLPFYALTQDFLVTPMSPDLAMNTAISFATTTTWQAYGGETTLSYFSQTVGLTTQNFLAGAAGLAVGVAFIRGFVRERSENLGNFWVDLTRGLLWVMLPLCLIGSLVLVWQGVPANFNAYSAATLVDKAITAEIDKKDVDGNIVTDVDGNNVKETTTVTIQTIAQGPVAVLEMPKNLGTNGGGFFNVNAAHPFENPTPLTNFLEMLTIILLPAALTYTFGRMTNRRRQGWLLFWVMMVLFIAGLFFTHYAEQTASAEITRNLNSTQNLEGKETRFGIGGSVLAAVTTSNGATGSYNSMHDSYTPIGGMIPLINMLLGEIIFGGLGTGLYSIIFTALVGLFLAGLMIGRKPEYMGKEIGVNEIKLIMIYTLAAPFAVLCLTALALVTSGGLAGLTTNDGVHGFTEILYAYASAFANNGQNFAGLSANSIFYNVTTAIAMMIGRFGLAIPALALAGSFARQGRRPVTLGTLPTDSLAFGAFLTATALIIGGLSYLPALALGPILEQFLLFK